MQPENPRVDAAGIARAISDMGNHVAAFDEQFAVERDADRSPGALAALDRRNRPALDGFDLRDLARGHDDDLVSGVEAAGFDAPGDNAAVVEFVDRLHRQPQRQRFQRPRRFKRVERLDYGRSIVPADPPRALGDT